MTTDMEISEEKEKPMDHPQEKEEEELDEDESSFQYNSVPEDDAWFFSKLLFIWERPLFERANKLKKRGEFLEYRDLLPLPATDHGDEIGSQFDTAWKKQQALEVELAQAEQHKQQQNQSSTTPAEKRATGATAPDDPTLDQVKDDKNDGSTTVLRRTLMEVMGSRFVIAGFIKALNTALQFCFPLLLNAILKFIEETQAGFFDDTDPWHVRYRGYWLAATLLVAMALKAVTENAYFHRVYRCAYQAKVAVSVSVYNKSLRLTNAERQTTTLGELVNLMQVDASKIEMFIPQVHVLWDGMFQILGYMAILYTLIGPSCLAGLVIMIISGPVQAVVMKRLFGLNRAMVKYTDARVEATNEAIQGISQVKFYTWEEKFSQRISASRSEELKFLKDAAYLRGFSRAYMGALPGIVAVGSFIVYALANSGAEISASRLFAALVAFDQLRFPLLFYPMSLAQYAQAKVSASRVEAFLKLKEIKDGQAVGNGKYTRNESSSAAGGIIVKDAEICWSDPVLPLDSTTGKSEEISDATSVASSTDKDASSLEDGSQALIYPKAILKDINFTIAQGELCAVVGRVASGKSTLCSAILNEAFLDKGEITLNGKVAYAAQSPWILNATLRDNILFGLPMDDEKYHKVLRACQLEHDLDLMDDGDLTEIGERGINLSGGQKARVSVARAAYSDAATIILDDPLSALDPEVGKLVFNECIFGLMAGKTRLLVTNQVNFLNSCDTVIALKKGAIIDKGPFDELMAKEGGEVRRLVMSSGNSSKSTRAVQAKDNADTDDTVKKPLVMIRKSALVTKEERNIGAVSLSVYLKYLKAGGGYLQFFLVYVGFILCVVNQIATTSWVSYWTADSMYERHSEAFYLGMYFTFAVTLGIFTFVRAYLLAAFGVKASEALHKSLLGSILNAPQSFFDTTPLGRILSRFSKDLYSIDLELSDMLDFFLFCSLSVVTSLGIIVFVTPWFGVAVVPLGFLYIRFLNYFRDVSRETKRLDSISRSPVYAHFSETLGGLSTIRAYGQPGRFRDDFESKVDNNTLTYYNNKSADRWLSVRLELIGSTVAGLAAIFACNVAIAGSTSGQPSDSTFASLAGLSLTFAISMTGLLQWCVRSFAQLEAAMNSSERILYYIENIPQEAPRTANELEAYAQKHNNEPTPAPAVLAVKAAGGKAETIQDSWPKEGAIVLKDLKMRYRTETPLVLKGLNVSIFAGERIGVVGRTGSGKSSLLLTLLRLVEPSVGSEAENYDAPMLIDGVDILRVGLKELRSKICIIPQNPVLFSGTIRSNIDPFDQFTDEQIWRALNQCGMKDSVESMPMQLDATVSEYGQNLSSGMRQMLVLGRALLRQCKILLLDEATSSVDMETDREIQRTLREEFIGCTTITIAHRINTIMDSDKILVMKDGLAAEFASPEELLKDEDSIFSDIVRHSEDPDN